LENQSIHQSTNEEGPVLFDLLPSVESLRRGQELMQMMRTMVRERAGSTYTLSSRVANINGN
jgi:hypothetical protein